MITVRKRAAAFAAAVIVLMSCIPPIAIAEGETISISTAEDFKKFTEQCAYDEYSRGKRFALLNDIDMNNVALRPAAIFCGEFAGGGHTVSNIKMETNGTDQGLFAYVSKDAKISDLTVDIKLSGSSDSEESENVLEQKAVEILGKTDLDTENIESYIDDSSDETMGGIAGYNAGIIVNCAFRGKVDGKKSVGGLVGCNAMTGIIDSCASYGTVNGDSAVGGIAGYNEGRIKFSKNNGTVCPDADENTVNVGGIAGNNKGAVEVCTNNGTVGGEFFGDNVGGITGLMSGETKECINNGTVQGRRSIGGISGRFEPYTDIELSYESARDSIEQQAQEIKDDIEEARQKVRDYIDDLTNDIFGLSSDEVKDEIEDWKNQSRDNLNSIADSSTNALDSIADAADSLNEAVDGSDLSGLTDSLRDAADSISGDVSEMTDDADSHLTELQGSLDTTLDNLNGFIDDFDAQSDDISELIDDLDEAVKNGDSNIDELTDKLSGKLDNATTDVNRMLNELSSMRRSIEDALDETGDTMNYTRRILRYLYNDVDSLINSLTDTQNSINNFINNIKNTLNSIPTIKPLSTLRPIPTLNISGTVQPLPTINIGDITGKLPTLKPSATQNPEETYEPLVTLVPESSSEPLVTLVPESSSESSSGSAAELWNKISSFLGSLFADARGRLFITARAYSTRDEDDENLITLEELQSSDITLPRLIGGENADTALLEYCINNGTVSGNESSGGVVGASGFESITKSGENLILPDGTEIDKDAILKARIVSCENTGEIESKSKYAGGIVGRADVGTVESCLSTGAVSSEDEGYVGGIAGSAEADISTCAAIGEYDGDSLIGGIAGNAKNIYNSYALPVIKNKKAENIGGIAGKASGTLQNNYFIDEGLGGVSGTTIEAMAQAVSPDGMHTNDGNLPPDMSGLSGYFMRSGDNYMPQIAALVQNEAENISAELAAVSDEAALFRFKVKFLNNGEELKTLTVDYGYVLKDEDIPEVDADGENLPKWDRDTEEPIIRPTTFRTEYDAAETTVSTGGEPPLMLVSGIFAENTELETEEVSAEYKFEGYDTGKAYKFDLSRDSYDKIEVHIRDENKKTAQAAVKLDGVWCLVDTVRDGSYDVFTMDEPGEFVLLYRRYDPTALIAAIAGAVLLAIIFIILCRRIKKHGKTKKKTLS